MITSLTLLNTIMATGHHDTRYTLLQRHSAEYVEINFRGTLLNQPVTWHAHIRTLRDDSFHNMNTSGPIQAQPYIDVGIRNGIHSITIALNLPVIDEAAILGTIIMVKQYKRLQSGRHHYGDMATFCFNTAK